MVRCGSLVSLLSHSHRHTRLRSQARQLLCVSHQWPGSGCGLDTRGSGLAAQLQTGLCVQSSGQASSEKLDRFGLVAASSKENSYNFGVLFTRDEILRGE